MPLIKLAVDPAEATNVLIKTLSCVKVALEPTVADKVFSRALSFSKPAVEPMVADKVLNKLFMNEAAELTVVLKVFWTFLTIEAVLLAEADRVFSSTLSLSRTAVEPTEADKTLVNSLVRTALAKLVRSSVF